MKSLQGYFVVAAPSLRDGNFFHSVVLLVRHNDEGAFGLVINRSSGTKVQEVWSQISQQPCGTDESIRVGGPIQGPLMALHTHAEFEEIEVLPGVYFAAGREQLEGLVGTLEPSARYFVGYAGWAAGQLESELEAGSWLTIEASRERVFADDDKFWESISREIGGSRLWSSLGIKHVPADPRLN